MRKMKRAVSPVIATVILVAVVITTAVTITYWMGEISGYYEQEACVPNQSVLEIGSQISGSYYYRGVIGDDTVVIGYGDRSYFLPIRYNHEYHVLGLHIRILKFDAETFELTISWISGGDC